ncbi:DUF4386 domain-containing protein [Paenibacillus gorillae]|uniref:DUF4386 domain-containing protein n=1 Tax=Paenibacillus gorillae TaxID=1243662 RepID=UPI001EE35CCC|nr:DUF4386 domain-containing protein [Paenibacillus gorillae]
MKNRTVSKRTALITGLLLMLGLVTGVFSVVPVIDGSDYLIEASNHANQVLLGAFFQLLMIIAYVGLPIQLYPMLSRHNKSLAIGSVAFGIIAGVFIMLGVILLLLLLTLSQEFTKIGIGDGSYVQTLGELLREGRDLVNHVATTLSFVLALFFFNCIFYKTRSIPRWLSVPGLLGAVLSILASLLFMVHLIGLDAAYMILNLPIALYQLVLAIWLIIKGFNQLEQASVSP